MILTISSSIVFPTQIVSATKSSFLSIKDLTEQKLREEKLDAEIRAEAKKLAAIEKERKLAAIEEAKKLAAIEKERSAIVTYINTRYYISKRAADKILSLVEESATAYKIPKTLILAVIAKESKFNPYAGSNANAEGLMQVIARCHPEKMKAIGGESNIVQAKGNIIAGTRVLREYLDGCGGGLVCALQTYNGAQDDPLALYADRVLTERSNIERYLKLHKT